MSILDIEKKDKNPIEWRDLIEWGFTKYAKDGSLCKTYRYGPQTKWVARFWNRGDIYKGEKLRSNRLVVRYANMETYQKEYDKYLKTRALRGKLVSVPQPTFKKMVMRNVSRDDFEMTMQALRTNYTQI